MTNPNVIPHQPEFIDNRAGNTMDAALIARIDHLARTLAEPPDVDIATGYFNAEGFMKVAAALEKARHVRLLLGAEPVPPPARAERHLGDPRGARFEAKLLREAWIRTEEGLLRDRDRIPFAPGADAAIRRLLEFLESGRIEVRRYCERFLHGKAYVFRGNGAIAGSSNFTAGGLTHNLELNLGQYQPNVCTAVESWFDDLWDDAESFDLARLYEARYWEYDPYTIYLRVLLERYGAELEIERPAGGPIPLARFQNDGIDRARRIMERYNGVIVADGVGLGKTFIAGEVLRRVIEQERRRTLLIAPATLRDGTWARFAHRFSLGLETISFEQLANDVQLGGTQAHLQSKREEYSLVVIDEAHALRNPDTRRAHALRQLLAGDPPRQVMMLTATPVNNGLWDLYHLLMYFVEHDAVFADLGIPKLSERFRTAVEEDPFTLNPKVLFDVLDATAVRRTRHFVQKWYGDDTVERPDGVRITIQFPRPNVAAVTYALDDVLPDFFSEVESVLQPADGDPPLKMARYQPTQFRRRGTPEKREVALVGLVRSGLLKRFESSARAFALTLERMVESHDLFLQGIDRGVVLTSETLTELAETESDEQWEELMAEGEALDMDEIDFTKLRRAVHADRDLLEGLRRRAATVTAERDPKLALLVEELVSILRRAEEAGLSEEDIRNRRKVIVFSYFADTAHWIHDRLQDVLASDRRLAAYRGRMRLVTGDDEGRKTAVYGFAPLTSEAPAGYQEDRFDILVTTDVLAEGVNLQQAARIVNYDLPWNPMRLVQRHGRIDRIGSSHREVWITCVFPDRQLEAMLALEDRIRRKLAQAAASVGLDSEILPGVESVDGNFADDVDEILRLRSGDATLFDLGGEDPRAHTGEEYRQELRKALQTREAELRAIPGGAGSGLVRGVARGHVFCARVDDRVLLRFVPLADVEIERDALACLRLITCEPGTPRAMPEDLREAAYAAWERARADIVSEWARASDPATLQPSIRPLWRSAAEHLRRYLPAEMSQDEQRAVIEALEAPRSLRDERALRKVFRPDESEGEQTSREVARFVKERGLQPWRPPEPLPPIEEEDVSLVVWMAVESDGALVG
ncbi:MAG: helicase-related protein [Gemmatimonadaceae bacterium]